MAVAYFELHIATISYVGDENRILRMLMVAGESVWVCSVGACTLFISLFLALQNIRTGKAHYLVICTCPDSGTLGQSRV